MKIGSEEHNYHIPNFSRAAGPGKEDGPASSLRKFLRVDPSLADLDGSGIDQSQKDSECNRGEKHNFEISGLNKT